MLAPNERQSGSFSCLLTSFPGAAYLHGGPAYSQKGPRGCLGL